MRADQTCLALFFFLRLGRQIRSRGSTCISGTPPARMPRHAAPPERRDQKKGGRTWEERNTTRNPLLSLRLSG
jgi:hypothetical protein